MKNKIATLTGIENKANIDKNNHADFLFAYQKAVLLTLLEQGGLNDLQYQQCIDKLARQFKE